ncbi:DUF4448 domain-containing protein [Aspergillus niger CBS 101883]|uniref:Contig An04c0180, complete genome n=5 Tax=Aspergillus niger TaxID=5061 RepID=A2QJ97_ASPNC|nr:uncharacterized protein An04g06300 [Aspergillus niger]XP_025457335.1 uncharacterized protein BO96DRAFT_360331 [Aspergillus niger CBS 101883]PYH59280.1 hypothetical protein BO96DRAFT_360331 [Aspergillus niger CBS 101883]RDH14512.1 hypothetical protein M747DRAFT_290439 [Aspergillus niger ATCC 13496]CAK38891.1 unnamed protein product [Aspergillus niger]
MIQSWRKAGACCLVLAAMACFSFGEAIYIVAGKNGAIVHSKAMTERIEPPPNSTMTIRRSSPTPGDFPICRDPRGAARPFCLPEDGANVTVGGTYYITWDADFYPLNATITIELRYADSVEGDSTFTSDRTDNSYGYTHIHMQQEWLQGKQQNPLTLYIIELDSVSDKRASARRGPTVVLHPKPVQHLLSPPPTSFNKLALYIGLPVSLSVVILVVAGLYFGMRESRRIDLGNIGGPGYGIRKSKVQRLGRNRGESAEERNVEETNSDITEVAQPGRKGALERGLSFGCKHDSSRTKSWQV